MTNKEENKNLLPTNFEQFAEQLEYVSKEDLRAAIAVELPLIQETLDFLKDK